MEHTSGAVSAKVVQENGTEEGACRCRRFLREGGLIGFGGSSEKTGIFGGATVRRIIRGWRRDE